MNEAKLNQDLKKALKLAFPSAVVLKHNDRTTSGIPDLSITYLGSTTWLETKLADPEIRDTAIQRDVCIRTSKAGCCLYVIFDNKNTPSTNIVHPLNLQIWRTDPLQRWPGFNNTLVVNYIRSLHQRLAERNKLINEVITEIQEEWNDYSIESGRVHGGSSDKEPKRSSSTRS